MFRTRQVRIRKGKSLWGYCSGLCSSSAALYNRANYLVRQYATAMRDLDRMKPLTKNQMEVYLLVGRITRGSWYEPKGRWLTYGQLDYILKRTDDPAYRALPAQANQQILKRLLRDYKSFFEARKVWMQHPERLTGCPKMPGYRKKGISVTAVLTNQICRIREGGHLSFPGTKDRLKLGPLPEGACLKEVRIRPCGETFTVEAVLELPASRQERKGRLAGLEPDALREVLKAAGTHQYRTAAIDPGVNNLCAVSNNFGAGTFLIKGRVIKSANHYYNKKMAWLKSEAMKCNGRHMTKRIRRLTERRGRIIKDLMHKASRRIADWAAANKVDLVVMGHNIFQKQNTSMGHVSNQNFVQIPYSVFAGMLRYKLEEKGIAFLETEESYTSKADYLALDPIPVYSCGKGLPDGMVPSFSGKRIRRGLYCHADGTRSNADINGAANILRKVFPNVTEWDRGVVDTPYVVRIA